MAGVPTSQLIYKSFQQYVADMSTSWGADTGVVPVLLSGDPALAIFQTAATQFLFLQFLMQAIVTAMRLSTATNGDCDTFVADFGLTRLPATYASGPVTLTALTAPTANISIPVGTVVQSAGSAIQYALIADTTQPTWNASLNAYVLPAGSTSISATAQALTAGSGQNAQAGQLTQLGSIIAGIDTVTNPGAITNGLDAESDAALKVRFVQFIASLSKATRGAIQFAINSVQQGLDFNIVENELPNATVQRGYFTVVVDDGSGDPPQSLLDAITNAIYSSRAFTIQFDVVGPTLVNITAALNIRVASGSQKSVGTVESNVAAALLAYVNGLQIGDTLYLNKLVEIAIDADPNVVSVQPGSVLIDGAAADLPATGFQLIRTAATSITVGSY